ncbi:hypothetical protein QVD17_01641 [Tagetes erecta]|uniref:Uncharacterized protein n=1 Tax=Tagetes erecta TaxID=13708 RepID=A0AAD8L585_TARER|nr:hypothetical protein QVD17_01641 [Tagetes erecta]
MSQSTNTHLLVYPFPGKGHIIPLLDLTHHLLRRGLTITVVISDIDLPLLDPLLTSHPSSLHKLLFSEPDIGPSSHPLVSIVIASQQLLFDPIVKWFKSHPSPPVAIVSDFFLGWTNELASHLGIPRVVFSPSGALGSSVFHTLWRDVAEINAGNGDGDENFLVSFPEIPNSPEFYWWQFTQLSRDYKEGDPDYEAFRKAMLANMKSWGIIYNTFQELEGVYIDYTKKQMGHDRVWAVGPLLPDEHDLMDGSRGGSSVVGPDDLLNCGSSFIPSGFEDQVADRGFIVKGWAPQLVILRHRAVGTFVTHCGWNSTLEGVVAGVMMLAWPMGADQYVDAKLLVDQLGVGKRVCSGGPENVPDSVELARLLDESLNGDKPERVKVKKLSQAAMKAIKEGTSIRDLNIFMHASKHKNLLVFSHLLDPSIKPVISNHDTFTRLPFSRFWPYHPLT